MKTRHTILFAFVLVVTLAASCKKEKPADAGIIQLASCTIGDVQLRYPDTTTGIANDADAIISFSSAIDTNSAKTNIILKRIDNTVVPATFSFTMNNTSVIVSPTEPLANLTDYKLSITSSFKGSKGETFAGIEYTFTTANAAFVIKNITINNQNFIPPAKGKNIQLNNLNIVIEFSTAPDPSNIKSYFLLSGNPVFDVTFADGSNTVQLHDPASLTGYTTYSFSVSSELKAKNGYTFNGFSNSFFTALDSTLKFPLISDDELLTLVQRQTFKYFYDYAHPKSGMARERYSSGNTVTTGGPGFGVMSLIVGMQRGFITREQGITHLTKIISFLETADRFHGAWSHWIDGNTGKVIPFGTKDNGGDLVETAFMAQGLIAMRQYLNPSLTEEKLLIDRITALYNGIEWDWYTRGGQNVLYWHWSPNYGWDLNFQLQGYNETLITYVMAAASPTHTIPAAAYHLGYARSGAIKNGKTFYGYVLPVGYDYGGPLFFAHYSFLGLDPRNLSDAYANYWTQNRNHSLINWKHCVTNPHKYINYNAYCWGLTASDIPTGYGVSEPTNDRGTITPTAAVSSLPYTPEESMNAIRYFYYIVGNRLWGQYGFYDAFDAGANWWANSYIAIDQGPEVVMIENYRTGLVWDLFMSAPEVKNGLTKLGFSYK
jgi:hypothetical protein